MTVDVAIVKSPAASSPARSSQASSYPLAGGKGSADAKEACNGGQLRIITLGRFRVLLPKLAGGGEPKWGNPQTRMLLKCLVAAQGQQLTCDQAIELLWPESDPERGRIRLRDTLSKLRRALEPYQRAYDRSSYVVSDRDTVSLVLDEDESEGSGIWLDCEAFERLAYTALGELERGGDARATASAALALYNGPFLPTDLYCDWSRACRENCARLWSVLVRRLSYAEASARNLDRAIILLGKLIDAVPDDEESIYLAMALHAKAGRRAEALRMYAALSAHLDTNLATAPNRELHALREAIRADRPMDAVLARLTNGSPL